MPISLDCGQAYTDLIIPQAESVGEAEEAVRQIGTDKRDKAKGGESMLTPQAGSAAH